MAASAPATLPASSRRDFLKTGAAIAALFGLKPSAIAQIAQELDAVEKGAAPVVWLQGQSCSGCSVSLLNSYPRIPLHILTQDISLKFHQTLSTATGHTAVDALKEAVSHPGYILVIEGAIPVGIPKACIFAHETFQDQLRHIVPKARAVIAVGACSSFGGVPAAEGNQTGAVSVGAFLKQEGFKVPLVNVPGCPPHPDWMVGTIVHLLRFGMPALDTYQRPLNFFRRTVHDQCPRFQQYERKEFATAFGGDGCLFKLGCQGPTTHGDCTIRKWNGGVSDCIDSGGSCVGCASHDFPRKKDFPMYYEVGRG